MTSNRLDALRGKRIAVIGDVMLDRYLIGVAERLSPEAPVPVVRLTEERDVLGGAANVAANLVALGATPLLVGVVGDDDTAEGVIFRLLWAADIQNDWLLHASITTTVKTRIVAQGQQMVRVDREEVAPYSEALERWVRDTALEAIASADAVVCADYDKGVLSKSVIAAIRSTVGARPWVVDPKTRLSRYRGATVLKPNRKEVSAAVTPGHDATLRDICGVEYLLVTEGAGGMTLVDASGSQHFPAKAREVFDVAGAGDTVTAWLAAGLAAGFPMVEAVDWANRAAGIVVGKRGVATVTPEEVLDAR